MSEVNDVTMWNFMSECPVPQDATNLLVEGETAIAAFKTIRDSAIFTNRRLIV